MTKPVNYIVDMDIEKFFETIDHKWLMKCLTSKVKYYGEYYKSMLHPTFRMLNRILEKWAMRKYKRLRGHSRRARYWLGRIANQKPGLFAQWQLLGLRPANGWTKGAV